MKKNGICLWLVVASFFLFGTSYADEIAGPKKHENKLDQDKPWWEDKIKISGSLYEYFIWQNNSYFNQLKEDSFLETTARIGMTAAPTDDLDIIEIFSSND